MRAKSTFFFPHPDLFHAAVSGQARQPVLGSRHTAGASRGSPTALPTSGMPPPTRAPWVGSSSRVRVVARARCAATAMIADQRVSHAFAAAARSQGGASAVRACARARVTCRASLPQPLTSIANAFVLCGVTKGDARMEGRGRKYRFQLDARRS